LWRALRPDVHIEPLRGNLDTRLKKLDEEQYAGIVLASAGLKRLGLKNRIQHTFDLEKMVPAAGQGAIGIEISSSRTDLVRTLTRLNDITTWVSVYEDPDVLALASALGASVASKLIAQGAVPSSPSSASPNTPPH